MHFRGKITQGETVIARRVEGEMKKKLLADGKKVYRGHFTTVEQPVFDPDTIYRVVLEDGLRTKIKVLSLLSDVAGMRVYSFYATHTFE